MHAFKLKHPVPELQPIGSVSLLGATPTVGDPQVAGAMIYGEPQDAFTCGLFSSTEGSFTMTYPFTEHATVLEGEVELTVAGGEPQRFAPGTAGLSNRVPKWNGKSSPHVSSNTIWRTSRRAKSAHGQIDGPGFRGHLVYQPPHSWPRSQIHPLLSTFRTIFVEQDARLNYDYPGVALAIPCSPLHCAEVDYV